MGAYGIKAIHPSSTATDNLPHVLAYATARTTAGHLVLDIWNGPSSSSRKFSIDKDGNVAVTSNIRTSASSALIAPSTSDAADNCAIFLAGGGDATSTRGAYIMVGGNESFSGAGDVTIAAGDVAGGDININTGGTNAGFITRAGVWTLGTGGVETGATRGDLVVKNTLGIRAVNAAANNTYALIGGNASDQVVIAAGGADIKWGKAEVALGGGAAPTLGTIGGSGPTVATQQGWLRVIASDGTVRWMPTWL